MMQLGAWRRRLSGEGGQTTAFFALLTVMLLGCGALVVDVGHAMLVQSRVQNAMDAGALAGAQQLPYDTTTAVTWTNEVAAANGYTPDQTTIGCSDSCVEASDQSTVHNSLASLLGIPTTTVAASSAATRSSPEQYTTPGEGIATQANGYTFYGSGSGSGGGGSCLGNCCHGNGGGGGGGGSGGGSGSPVSPLNLNPSLTGQAGLLPFGITVDTALDTPVGGQITLKFNSSGGSDGNFGALALGGNGAAVYKNNVIDGFSGLTVCQVVDTEPGNMAGPTDQAMETRMQTYGSATQVVVVPVVTYGTTDCTQNQGTQAQGKTNCVVRGFAAVALTSYTDEPGNAGAVVTGQLLGANLPCEPSGPAAVDTGVYASSYEISPSSVS